MQLLFSVTLFLLVLLIHISNPKNIINRWCALGGLIFLIGLSKEAMKIQIIPYIERLIGNPNLHFYYENIYSLQSWVLYVMAMPVMLVFASHFCSFKKLYPKKHLLIIIAFFMSVIVFALFVTPFDFATKINNSSSLAKILLAYNVSYCIVYVYLMIKGDNSEQSKSTKLQKTYVRIVSIPPVIFWILSTSIPHVFGFESYYGFWHINTLMMIACLSFYFIIAFRRGFMGLKLTGEMFNWNSDMMLINKGAVYNNHMLKNQITKIDICIENLSKQFEEQAKLLQNNDINSEKPEEFDILSRSINTIKKYSEKVKKQSDHILLSENKYQLYELISFSIPTISTAEHSIIKLNVNIPTNIYLICDRNHMCEVFTNFLQNSIEALNNGGNIFVDTEIDGKYLLIRFADDGYGLDPHEINRIFEPYFTTKNTEQNFGLGLAYCKNAVENHGATIQIKNRLGGGTIFIIKYPLKKVSIE